MQSVVPLIFRRMRIPLVVLVSAYSIAVLVFTLIPGVDDQGNPWRMSFFEALYVVSYTGSTIGFGEVPYDFSNGQRLWTIISIYLTVIAWLYSIGTIISLLQDSAFRQALNRSQLRRSLRSFAEPFYLVCGYGDTGKLLVRSLTDRKRRVVVIDNNRENIDELSLKDLSVYVPGFCLDARIPENLLIAGLQHRRCAAVLAVTDDDQANLQIAITSKLLSPKVTVYCRAKTQATVANMQSFGTDYVIDPFEEFAQRLALVIREPDTHRVYEWLSAVPNTKLPEGVEPPKGRWILCGFGRMGKAVYKALRAEGIEVTVVDENPQAHNAPKGTIFGKGTEACTLQEARIDQAAALLAATADDADNLSIIVTARELNPDLFIVARENRLHNKALFRAAKPQLVMEPSYIITTRILSVLTTPLLEDFLRMARGQSNQWNQQLAQEMRRINQELTPESFSIRVSLNRCPGLTQALKLGKPILLETLCRDPRNREQFLEVLPLLLRRGEHNTLLPTFNTPLEIGDRILFCGSNQAQNLMRRGLNNLNTLQFLFCGEQCPDGLIWRYMGLR
ncbi:potassium channel family protein [Thiorhodospira sibirica]|uniref:potassium channel family protein n=1 Tax=Thiorhodospira sibirica TaxID=154347 RepID=UPI00022C0BAC|nr:NAD-binding protein [Thiorhodospira sibirica]